MRQHSKRWIILVCYYLFPWFLNWFHLYDGLSSLTETGLVISIVYTFLILPGVYVFANKWISRILKFRSSISAVVLFTGIFQNILSGYFILKLVDKGFSVDVKTVSIYAAVSGVYLFLSLIYYLVKKDDNIEVK